MESFSDGVFAIAMTLLVLEFKVPSFPPGSPEDSLELLRALLALWPSFLAFTLSFGTVLIMWVNHHGLFRHAHRATPELLFANGFLLLVVTLVPFPTAVLAAYLDRAGARAAAAFYCGTYVLVSVAYNLLGHAVVHSRAGVQAAPAGDRVLARIQWTYRAGLLAYLLATVLALFSALGGLAVCLLLWGLWVFLDYGRHSTI